MAENHEGPLGGDPRTPAHPEGDRDVPVGTILKFCGGIALLLLVSAGISWVLFGVFKRDLTAMDPPPFPLPEANEPVVPPEPRLQESPEKDMDALRAREGSVLDGYGWVDKGAGIGRIPIERAIELTLNPGLRAARSGGSEAGGSGGSGGGRPDGGAP